jgi:ureidoglycolate amidohydrolase
MALRFPQLPLLLLCFCCSVIIAHKDEDPVTKTMEDFSGYPIDEPHSFFQKSLTLLSVDTESLQKEVLGLAFTGFLFEESGCDNNNVCVY